MGKSLRLSWRHDLGTDKKFIQIRIRIGALHFKGANNTETGSKQQKLQLFRSCCHNMAYLRRGKIFMFAKLVFV